MKNTIIARGLPTNVDSADAVAAAISHNRGLQGATVGWAASAVDGGAGGGFGGTGRWGQWRWRVTAAGDAAREPFAAEGVARDGGGGVRTAEDGDGICRAGEGSRRR